MCSLPRVGQQTQVLRGPSRRQDGPEAAHDALRNPRPKERVSLPKEGSLLPESDCVKMKRCKDERVAPPTPHRLSDAAQTKRNWGDGSVGRDSSAGWGVLPLCPCVQLSWVSRRLSRELSKGPFPLSPDRAAGSVARGPEHPLPPQVPGPSQPPPCTPTASNGPVTGHSLEFPCTFGPQEGWARWLTEALCRHRVGLWRSRVAPDPDPDPELVGGATPLPVPDHRRGRRAAHFLLNQPRPLECRLKK